MWSVSNRQGEINNDGNVTSEEVQEITHTRTQVKERKHGSEVEAEQRLNVRPRRGCGKP